MSSDRFHKAAKDGLLDVLKDATRKDANAKDEDSMTPVLWAAFEGKLSALRLLCGRGGDPDKCDQFGNTALHLAAAKGHFHCVDFLVKFGVNIYALDIDKHSAKELAAINNRDDILRYLDAAAASFEANERKKAKALKELAEKNCEKRVREYMKRQQRLENAECGGAGGNTPNTGHKSTKMLSTLKQKIWSSQGNLHKPTKGEYLQQGGGGGGGCAGGNGTCQSTSAKFSDLVGSNANSLNGSLASRSTATVGGFKQQHRLKDRDKQVVINDGGGGFKIGEIEPDGKRTITSLTGLQRDSEVLYVGTFSSNEENAGAAGKRGKISDVFEVEDDECGSDTERSDTLKFGYGTLSRSYSQPDFLSDSNERSDRTSSGAAAGLFDRPMLGSIAFRRSVTAALSQLQQPDPYALESDSTNVSTNAKSRKGKQQQRGLYLNLSDDSDSDAGNDFSDADDVEDDDDEDSGTPIQRFLTVWGLEEYLAVFQKQEIDLETLMLLTEADLKSLGLPLGPFRKLTFAIQERKNALTNPGIMQDTCL